MKFMKIIKTNYVLLVLISILHEEASSVAAYIGDDFPNHFIFGASTSANQVEGATFMDGRTPSFADTWFTNTKYENTWITSVDQYHKYKEDVKLMVDIGLDAYKFSISWSRLIPNGRGPVNPKGVEYYNNLINELISRGIQPHVILLHWDLPQTLWDDYGGGITRGDDFTAYAEVCFREFGDRVLHWTTINEANNIPIYMCDKISLWSQCTSNNASYIDAHNLLLAHASIVNLYRTKYQGKQHGCIGLNIYTMHYVPETNLKEDILATERARDFLIGWFMNPLMVGEYPETMKKFVGNRLPSFTKYESELVKNSFDFIGINCYTSVIVKNYKPNSQEVGRPNYSTDMAAKLTYSAGGEFVVHPILEYFKQDYGNPLLYIHEIGFQMSQKSSLNDQPRIKYLNTSIGSLLDAIRNGSRVQGLFVWSLLDVSELHQSDDNPDAFGLYYVDLDDPDFKRYPKSSAYWYASFLNARSSKAKFSNRFLQTS